MQGINQRYVFWLYNINITTIIVIKSISRMFESVATQITILKSISRMLESVEYSVNVGITKHN